MAKRKSKGSTINTKNYKYVTLRARGKDGSIHYSRGNGDAVHKAMLLHVANGGTMKQVIDANKFDKFSTGGNGGTLRMSVGVALRAAVRAGEPVKIGKVTVKSLKQPVKLPELGAATRAAPKRKAKKPVRKPRASKPAPETPAEAPAPQV
jgi:hypothetical protein